MPGLHPIHDAVLTMSTNNISFFSVFLEGTIIYGQAIHQWSMSDGYNEMLGVSGMKVCFVEGNTLFVHWIHYRRCTRSVITQNMC